MSSTRVGGVAIACACVHVVAVWGACVVGRLGWGVLCETWGVWCMGWFVCGGVCKWGGWGGGMLVGWGGEGCCVLECGCVGV